MSKYRGVAFEAEVSRDVEPGLTTLYDRSRYGNDGTMTNVTWAQLPSGLWVMVFNGASSLVDRANATTLSMGLRLNQGYTIEGWINWEIAAEISQIVIGRYELDVSGWELYLSKVAAVVSLTQRHHHAGTIVDANPRSATFSNGWTENTPLHMAVVFQGNGTDCIHYRNAVPVAVTSSTGGIRAFEETAQDLVIGARYTKDANWYQGEMSKLIMHDYILTPGQVLKRFEATRSLFGV